MDLSFKIEVYEQYIDAEMRQLEADESHDAVIQNVTIAFRRYYQDVKKEEAEKYNEPSQEEKDIKEKIQTLINKQIPHSVKRSYESGVIDKVFTDLEKSILDVSHYNLSVICEIDIGNMDPATNAFIKTLIDKVDHISIDMGRTGWMLDLSGINTGCKSLTIKNSDLFSDDSSIECKEKFSITNCRLYAYDANEESLDTESKKAPIISVMSPSNVFQQNRIFGPLCFEFINTAHEVKDLEKSNISVLNIKYETLDRTHYYMKKDSKLITISGFPRVDITTISQDVGFTDSYIGMSLMRVQNCGNVKLNDISRTFGAIEYTAPLIILDNYFNASLASISDHKALDIYENYTATPSIKLENLTGLNKLSIVNFTSNANGCLNLSFTKPYEIEIIDSNIRGYKIDFFENILTRDDFLIPFVSIVGSTLHTLEKQMTVDHIGEFSIIDSVMSTKRLSYASEAKGSDIVFGKNIKKITLTNTKFYSNHFTFDQAKTVKNQLPEMIRQISINGCFFTVSNDIKCFRNNYSIDNVIFEGDKISFKDIPSIIASRVSFESNSFEMVNETSEKSIVTLEDCTLDQKNSYYDILFKRCAFNISTLHIVKINSDGISKKIIFDDCNNDNKIFLIVFGSKSTTAAMKLLSSQMTVHCAYTPEKKDTTMNLGLYTDKSKSSFVYCESYDINPFLQTDSPDFAYSKAVIGEQNIDQNYFLYGSPEKTKS